MIRTVKMTEEEYRKHVGVNKSTLWEIRKSPAHYKWALEHPGEDTPALRFGRAIHTAVLQPREFNKRYAVAPDGIDRRTKEGRAAWADFMESVGDREVLTDAECDEIRAIAKSVRKCAGTLLKGCKREVPLFWDDPRTGIYCKCRIDAIREDPDRVVVIDLKTTMDAGLETFTRSAIRYGYHVQAAHYMEGVRATLETSKPIEWWFIAVEKKAPYAVSLIRADQGLIDEGMYRRMSLMDRLDECMRTDTYPGYGVNVMYMPAWAVGNDEEEEE